MHEDVIGVVGFTIFCLVTLVAFLQSDRDGVVSGIRLTVM